MIQVKWPETASVMLEVMGIELATIKLRLTMDQVSVIWPGLDYIVNQYLTWQGVGDSLTCYPLRIQPPPPGFDSGTFSARMMESIRNLWVKIKPIRTGGGELWLGEFELRAAAFAARTSMKVSRRATQQVRKSGINADSTFTLKNQQRRKDRVIKSLEVHMKRSKRRFRAAAGISELTLQSKEWQSHLRWIQLHLTYFKPYRPLNPSLEQVRRQWVDVLVQMAETSILNQNYELPDRAKLRAVIRQFLRYSRRGRSGSDSNHVYLLNNVQVRAAQWKLLEFVQERLLLKEAR